MADLTDSFCERCGTRYSFTETAQKGFSLKGARVLAKGLRNFVLTDGQSMSDAIENARLETSTETSSRVTEAFHATFNFCMECRQYACSNCWNVKVGACLSCAPETNVRSVSPRDHLIVRTPVARWDGDWAITPDGPVREALLGQDSPAPTKPQGIVPMVSTNADAAPAVWPTVDLLEQQMAAIVRGRAARAAHQNKQAEPTDGSLWAAGNMTDEATPPAAPAVTPAATAPAAEPSAVTPAATAPAAAAPAVTPAATAPAADPSAEMALTPQELMLIRAELSPNDDFPPPTFVDRRESPSPRELAAQWLSIRQTGIASEPEAAPPDHRLEAEPAAPRRLVPPLAPLPRGPLARPPELEPSTRGHAPIVGRILGRNEEQSPAKSRVRRRGSDAGETADPWPRVTSWADRPLAAHDEWIQSQAEQPPQAALLAQPHIRKATAASAASAASAATAATAPDPRIEPAHQPFTAAGGMRAHEAPPEQARAADTLDESGVRRAAAVPLLAVTHSRQARQPGAAAGRPARQDPPIELPAARQVPIDDRPSEQPHEAQIPDTAIPSWPAADTEVAIAVSRRIGATSPDEQARPGPAPRPSRAIPIPPGIPAPPPQEAHPWPPLGARYSPRPASDVPWSAPDPQFPAVLAAAQIRSPILADMWAQSSEEVINRGTVRVCHRCALPVSTQARFCRRCGSPQS